MFRWKVGGDKIFISYNRLTIWSLRIFLHFPRMSCFDVCVHAVYLKANQGNGLLAPWSEPVFGNIWTMSPYCSNGKKSTDFKCPKFRLMVDVMNLGIAREATVLTKGICCILLLWRRGWGVVSCLFRRLCLLKWFSQYSISVWKLLP